MLSCMAVQNLALHNCGMILSQRIIRNPRVTSSGASVLIIPLFTKRQNFFHDDRKIKGYKPLALDMGSI